MHPAVALALASALFAFGTAAADAEELSRITGKVTYENFPRLEAFLLQAVGKSVALDLTLAVNNDETEGNLTTFVLDGQFEIAYLQPGEPSRIYADTGFDLVNDDHYTLQSVFSVEASDRAIGLNEVDAPAETTYKDVSVDDLPTRTGN
ncbi:hypothetical protein [Oryzicola mucosus]|uniref:DUF4179 domain-containing protein n=1 Tax=Oryzicola mucosus TaxID=2767425 RepID=A0A8J6PIG3_9HYPH|nr:hypothetical protein [Oryzicola mucosus]MBD0414126.1 hypothetical protein [Oryzicola mucosus]